MASTLIGTVLGGLLAILGGYLVGLKQRAWQKEQAMFERDLAKEQAQFERELSITKALGLPPVSGDGAGSKEPA